MDIGLKIPALCSQKWTLFRFIGVSLVRWLWNFWSIDAK